jgi:hypothetical protein
MLYLDGFSQQNSNIENVDMLEIFVFLLFQIIFNIIIRVIHIDRLTCVFVSLSLLVFGILILTYPSWSYRIYNFFYPSTPVSKCGNAQIGAIFFQLFIGTPLVILFQLLFNRHFHKIESIASEFENKKNTSVDQ